VHSEGDAMIGPDASQALLRRAGGAMRRLADRDTLLLAVYGVSIPAAWGALWYVVANLISAE
jgi:hypothetical protein